MTDTAHMDSGWHYKGTTWKPVPPAISVFDGIVVDMIFDDEVRHHPPHIHAQYGDYEASIAIDEGTLLSGNLPTRQIRLVLGWIELRRNELMENWNLAASGSTVRPIAPLR